MRAYRKAFCLSIISTLLLILLTTPTIAQLPTATILGGSRLVGRCGTWRHHHRH